MVVIMLMPIWPLVQLHGHNAYHCVCSCHLAVLDLQAGLRTGSHVVKSKQACLVFTKTYTC